MAIWRPVSGSITRLDPTLASVEQIEDFFAERRIIARGAVSGEDGYRVELAVTGRRRRVATLTEDGEVAAGPSLSELESAKLPEIVELFARAPQQVRQQVLELLESLFPTASTRLQPLR